MGIHAWQQFQRRQLQRPPFLSTGGEGYSGMELVGDGGGVCLPLDMQRRIGQMKTAASFPSPTELLNIPVDDQSRDFDQLLRLQGQELSAALRQQQKRHIQSMVRLLESRASALLRLKEEELTRAGEATAALEERLRQSEAENRAWQCLAREAEAMAQALTEALRQIRDSQIAAASRCEGSFSDGSAGGGGGDPEGEEEEQARWRREAAAIRRCRGCGSEDLQVLFLPCMHLSTCNLCGPLLPACPVCKSVKQDTIEVFLP